MIALRRLGAQRHLAVLIFATALLLKLLVPTGYMIASDHGRIAITICTGVESATAKMDMPAMRGTMPDHGKSKDHGKAEQPCAFAGLTAAMTGAIDPIQLVELIAFIVAIGLAGVLLPAPGLATYLRPPLRGPPSLL